MTASAVLMPDERRFVVVETVIGGIVNGLLPAALIWLLAENTTVPFEGRDGIVARLLPPTLGVGLTYPIILTLVIRMRQRKGKAPATGWRRGERRWLRLVPGNLLLRGLLGALVSFVVMIPLAIAAANLLAIGSLSKTGFIFFNLAYGIGLGLLLTPAVVLSALADRNG